MERLKPSSSHRIEAAALARMNGFVEPGTLVKRTGAQASAPNPVQGAHEARDSALLAALQTLLVGASAENPVHHAYT